MGFSGFTQADFTAFEESKWSSNAFNRERLEVKLKLSELGRELAPGLFSKLPEQEMGMTEERPSIFNQHKVDSLALFFIRDAESRRHLFTQERLGRLAKCGPSLPRAFRAREIHESVGRIAGVD